MKTIHIIKKPNKELACRAPYRERYLTSMRPGCGHMAAGVKEQRSWAQHVAKSTGRSMYRQMRAVLSIIHVFSSCFMSIYNPVGYDRPLLYMQSDVRKMEVIKVMCTA